MGHRLANLELAVEFIQRDMVELRADLRTVKADVDGFRMRESRILFGAILTMGLGLAGLLSIGFHWL